MQLQQINAEDLIFSGEIEDSCTNTRLTLADYDWMNYTLSTKFKTAAMGQLNVVFEYRGCTTSLMEVEQHLHNQATKFVYEFSTELFEDHIAAFLVNHIRSWDSEFAFDGEKYVIDFFNDVIKNGELTSVVCEEDN